jgi:hypothetical protein
MGSVNCVHRRIFDRVGYWNDRLSRLRPEFYNRVRLGLLTAYADEITYPAPLRCIGIGATQASPNWQQRFGDCVRDPADRGGAACIAARFLSSRPRGRTSAVRRGLTQHALPVAEIARSRRAAPPRRKRPRHEECATRGRRVARLALGGSRASVSGR